MKPNQVSSDCTSIGGLVNYDRGKEDNDYNATFTSYEKTCNDSGLKYYNFSNSNDIIAAINNELSNKRSVVVKTDWAGEHWVTVTGTNDGEPADNFSDFIGVDPWYNGLNPNNLSNMDAIDSNNGGAGGDSNNISLSGVITLSNNDNQTFHSDYAMFVIA